MSAKLLPPRVAPLLGGEHVEAPDDRVQREAERLRQLAGGREAEPGREHADDRGRLAVQEDDAAADRGIRREAALPQAVRDEHEPLAVFIPGANVRPTTGCTPRTSKNCD